MASLRDVDWIEVVGQSAVSLLGPVGTPLKALLLIRQDLRRQTNEELAAVPSRSADADIRAIMDPVVREVGLEASDATAFQFLFVLAQRWASEDHTAETFVAFVNELAIAFWLRSAEFRTALAQDAYAPEDVRLIARDAGIDLTRVALHGTAEHQWQSILEYLRTQEPGAVLYLMYVAHSRYPADDRLALAFR